MVVERRLESPGVVSPRIFLRGSSNQIDNLLEGLLRGLDLDNPQSAIYSIYSSKGIT